MIPLDDYPENGHFAAEEWFHERDKWADPVTAWRKYEENALNLIDKFERARIIASAARGRVCTVRIYRGYSSPEYNAAIYKRRGKAVPVNVSQHSLFNAGDAVAREKSTGRIVPAGEFARHLEAAGFQRVAVILDSKGVPCGNHADDKPGPLVSVGYTPVYPGRIEQKWY